MSQKGEPCNAAINLDTYQSKVFLALSYNEGSLHCFKPTSTRTVN